MEQSFHGNKNFIAKPGLLGSKDRHESRCSWNWQEEAEPPPQTHRWSDYNFPSWASAPFIDSVPNSPPFSLIHPSVLICTLCLERASSLRIFKVGFVSLAVWPAASQPPLCKPPQCLPTELTDFTQTLPVTNPPGPDKNAALTEKWHQSKIWDGLGSLYKRSCCPSGRPALFFPGIPCGLQENRG